VANFGATNVSVINGGTNAVTATVPAGSNPYAVAVNPVTNQIYAANYNSKNVTVINGASNTVAATVAAGTNPQAVAVNPVTNEIYVANGGSANVTVINGANNGTSTAGAGSDPTALAVNPVTNMIYVANKGSNFITVINNSSGVGMTSNSTAAGVNPLTNLIYVANYNSAQATVINGATEGTTTLAAGTNPYAVAVNPVTNKIYVANNGSANVTVIDGSAYTTSTVAAGNGAYLVAVNTVANKIYSLNFSDNTVTIIDGVTSATTTVPVGNCPVAIAVNPVTNYIYTANNCDSTVTVINGATNATTTVATGSNTFMVDVNPVTNKIYVANYGSHSVTVIDGATNATTSVAVGTLPVTLAVNPATNKIYVATDSPDFTVIDGATNTPTILAGVANPNNANFEAVAVNSVTNKIYVAGWYKNVVTVIDGATNTITATVGTGAQPAAVAVNPATNQIYAVSTSSTNNLTVIDGATNTANIITAGTSPFRVAVNQVTNKIYLTNVNNSSITVVDGASNNTIATYAAGALPEGVAVNPVTNRIYVGNGTSNNVTVIAGQPAQPNALTSFITALPGNASGSLTPTLSFQTPITFKPDNFLFQLDSWQDVWTAATPNGGSCVGNPPTCYNDFTSQPTLQPGFHILYAYATDGEEATSTNTGLQSSPLVGNITAYQFLVAPPSAFISPGGLSFGNQVAQSTSAAKVETLSNSGAGTLNITGIVASKDYNVINNNCPAALQAGATCTFGVTFTPTVIGTDNGTLTVTDNSASGSPQVYNLTGTGTAPVTLNPTSLTFASQPVLVPSAPMTVTLTNDNPTSALPITSIVASVGFSQTNTCGTSVAALGTCTISVTSTPTATGPYTGSITITDNLITSPQTESLKGTGVQPVTIGPTSLTFPGQPVLVPSAPMTVTLTNNNPTTALPITSIVPSANFTETNTCGSSVAALGTCTISVTFTPTATGAYTGSITITDNASTSPQTVSLAGTGVAPVTISPTSLTFANQPILIPSAPMTVTLTNNNPTSALPITSIVASAGFNETNTCGTSVAARGTCAISVTSTPTATGAYTGSITVTDNATTSPQTISLAGTGIAQATAGPKSLVFPAQTVGTRSAAKVVTLTNNLPTALTFTVTFAGADHGDFTATNGCGGTVAAGSHCTIDVRFTPHATGTRTATLEINDSAAGAPQKVSLNGTGQ
jgi:YVTN family beta-propeller protein